MNPRNSKLEGAVACQKLIFNWFIDEWNYIFLTRFVTVNSNQRLIRKPIKNQLKARWCCCNKCRVLVAVTNVKSYGGARSTLQG